MFFSKLRAVTFSLLTAVFGGGGLFTYHFVASGSQVAAAVDGKMIGDLIKKLGDDDFKARQAAVKRLVGIGEPALALVRKALENTDPEVCHNAQLVVKAIEKDLFGEVRRFEGHTGVEVGRWVTRVAVTPNGKQAVSVSSDGLRVWDLKTGKQVLLFGKHRYLCWGLAIARDGKRVIVAGRGRVACVYELKTGKLVQRLAAHAAEISGAVLSADGKRAVTGGWDQSLRVWDVETGKELYKFTNVRGYVRCLALSPSGKQVAAGHFTKINGPGTVRLWDVATGKEIKAFEGHTLEVSSVAFSPDGKRLLSSSFDRTIRLWDVETAKELKRFKGHTNSVEYVAITPDGKRVVSCGNENDPTVRLWDAATGQQLRQSEAVARGLLSVTVLPDNCHCVTTGKDGIVRLWRWKK